MVTVIKRDGTPARLDINRIRQVINWATAGLDVAPLELESGMTARLREGISTRSIQENLIYHALELCSVECPDWRYVAGRLHIWSLYKETLVSRGYRYGSYAEFVSSQVKAGKYDNRITAYSSDELREAGSWINPDWDLDYDYAGANLLTTRYLQANELPQEAFVTCALLLALPEKAENRLKIARQIYVAIASRKVSLATPILGNLRVPNGSLSSCFIMSLEDTLESIFGGITNTAKISKNGGGVGVILSRIRALGSWVMSKANASGGVIPWIKLLNDTAIAVNQGGRRAGAVTVGLDVWHLDIPEFLEMQTENGDQRRKAYDVFPQVIIPDEFMNRVVNDAMWTLVDPYEVRTKLNVELAELWGDRFNDAYKYIESEIDKTITLYKQVKARDLFKIIMRSQIETGMPYLAFKDTINRANPNKHDGYIPGVNLCNESFSNVKPGELIHCCNLVSLNLANIRDDSELEGACRLAVRILDNTIELTTPPIREAANHNSRYRTIGVGVMGLADWMAIKGIKYSHLVDSRKGDEVAALFNKFAFYCTDESANLAIERGQYPAFEGSDWSQGMLPMDGITSASASHDWEQLRRKILETGIRNSHITAIAPNTSSSLVQGCTASILPVFSRFFINKAGKGSVPIAPPYIKESYWFYDENKTMSQQAVVNMTAIIQQYIDTGISMELMFNLNQGIYHPSEPDRAITAKEIYEILISAWRQNIKAIYYVRTVQKDSFDNTCSSCAN